MLKQAGIHEIFLPKIVPDSFMYRSASVDYSEDVNLSIPEAELNLLNKIDWYESPTYEALEIANKYFQIVFFIATPAMIRMLTKYFQGAMILRAYGLDRDNSYHNVMNLATDGEAERMIKTVGRRFWFGQVFKNIDQIEPKYIKKQSIFFPLGTFSSMDEGKWLGGDKKIFFVCPDIKINKYYGNAYEQFKKDFAGLPYKIAGVQPIMPKGDPNILGFVSRQQHERNMREMRVMFYHSREPRHLHYHPIEAIQAGMPLIYMGGGVLDNMAGNILPGRCEDVKEARYKVARILNDDFRLIEKIRETQPAILEAISHERCAIAWRESIEVILDELQKKEESRPAEVKNRRRIAVILPHLYRGGTLRAAKLVAQAISTGAGRSHEDVEVVLAHINDNNIYSDEDFSDLPSSISRRPFQWELLDPESSARAMAYAGRNEREVCPGMHHFVMNDGVSSFSDCDLWVFISDRVPGIVLPLRPYSCMVYDYIQRYENVIPRNWDDIFINFVRHAKSVMVTTKFTARDALQYAGVPQEKIRLLPNILLASENRFPPNIDRTKSTKGYFLWVTNAAPHKNHLKAVAALIHYYEVLQGRLECHIVGVGTNEILNSNQPHLCGIKSMIDRSPDAKRRIKWCGELSEHSYHRKLSGAAFLLHPAIVDNGTYSVIEAAKLQVPSLSNDYPAMREIDEMCHLSLVWMDSNDLQDVSIKIKWMENNFESLSVNPEISQFLYSKFHADADEYWSELKNLLN